MLMKWLLFLALGYVAYRWWSRASAARPSGPARGRVEDMVKCAHCGIHFPKNEAVLGDERHFCCEQHSAAWKRSH